MMPMLQTQLFEPPTRLAHWRRVKKFDPRACWLADRHYSRRKIGSPQFMPPGQTIVLLSMDGLAVFGWWRPHPDAGLEAMNGLDGWTCTIFRNESPTLSSDLILDAEKAIPELGYDIGPDGLLAGQDRMVSDGSGCARNETERHGTEANHGDA